MDSVLADKFAITEVIYRYCRSLDRLDRDLAATVWNEGATADYGITYQGPASGLLDHFWPWHSELLGHSHQVTNILIEVDGDRAGSESYLIANLWRETESGGISRMESIGRYLDTWSRRNGVWAIDHRRVVLDSTFSTSYPPAGGNGEQLSELAAKRDPRVSPARRDRTDPSYAVMG